ncbi:MAG TPA: hypothetical protein VFA78_00305 [Chloroflexota bacterium]|nr:hypothetical protein [Chloroflexota bacterium]
MEDRVNFEQLRLAYDAAFEQLRNDMEALNAAGAEENDLQRRLLEAQLEYRLRRDELADFILKQQEEHVCATCAR